ncbi:hypothetical protein BC938DRAFT_472271, partial [Jimgerdemannia flammicorona]
MADGKDQHQQQQQPYFPPPPPPPLRRPPTYSRSLPPPPVRNAVSPLALSPQLAPQFLSISPDSQTPVFSGLAVARHPSPNAFASSSSEALNYRTKFRDLHIEPGTVPELRLPEFLQTLQKSSSTTNLRSSSNQGSTSHPTAMTRPPPAQKSPSTYNRDLAETEVSGIRHDSLSSNQYRSTLRDDTDLAASLTLEAVADTLPFASPGIMTPQSDFSFTSETPMLSGSNPASNRLASQPPQFFGLYHHHHSNIDLVSVSPDGTTVASFSRDDGIVITWVYRPGVTATGAGRSLGKLEARGTYRTGFFKRQSSFVGSGDGGTGGRILPPGEAFLAVSNYGQFIALSSCIVASSGNTIRGQVPGQYALRPSTPNPADSFLLLSTETQSPIRAQSFVNLYGVIEFLPTARLGVCDGTHVHILSTTNWTLLYKLDLAFLTQDIGGAWVNAFDQLQLVMSSLRFGMSIAWLEPYASLSLWQITLGADGSTDTTTTATAAATTTTTTTTTTTPAPITLTPDAVTNGNADPTVTSTATDLLARLRSGVVVSGGGQGETQLFARVMLGHDDHHRAFRHGKVFVRTALSNAGDLLAVYTVPLEGDIPSELTIYLVESGGIPLSRTVVVNKIDFIGFTDTDHPEFVSSSTVAGTGATATVLVTLGTTPYGDIATEVWEPYSCTLLGTFQHHGLERASIVPWATQLGSPDGGWFVENLGKALQIHPLMPSALTSSLGIGLSAASKSHPATLVRLQPGHHFSHPTERFIVLASGLHPEHKIFFAHSAQAINPEPWVANRLTPDVFAYFLDHNRVLIAGDYSIQVWAFGGGRFGGAAAQERERERERGWNDGEDEDGSEEYGNGAAAAAAMGGNDDVTLQYIWTTPVSPRASVPPGGRGLSVPPSTAGSVNQNAPINNYQLIQQIWIDTENADAGEYILRVRLSQSGHKDVVLKLPPADDGETRNDRTREVSVRTLRDACRAVKFMRDVRTGRVEEDGDGSADEKADDMESRFWVVKRIREMIERGVQEHPEVLSVVNGGLYPMQDWLYLGWDSLVLDFLATGQYIPCFHVARSSPSFSISVLGATPPHTTESALTLAIALKRPAIVWALLEYMANRAVVHSGYMITAVKALPALLVNYPDYVDRLMEEHVSWFPPTSKETPRELLRTEVVNGRFERSTQEENYAFAVDEMVGASRRAKGKGKWTKDNYHVQASKSFGRMGKNISHPARLYLLPLPKLFDYSEQLPNAPPPTSRTEPSTTTTTLPVFSTHTTTTTTPSTKVRWWTPTTSLFAHLALDPNTNSGLLFRHPSVSNPIISFKWRAFARTRFLALWIFYLVYFVVYAVTVTLATPSAVSATLRALVLVMAILVIVQEARKVRLVGGVSGYVHKLENSIRLIGAGLLPLGVATVMIAGVEGEVEVGVVVISVLFLWLNILLHLRIYKPFGIFLYRISNITQTLLFFLVLLAVLVLAFSQAFYILLKDTQPTRTTTFPTFTINSVPTAIPSVHSLADQFLEAAAVANNTISANTTALNQTLTGTINATFSGPNRSILFGNITITAPQAYFRQPVIPPCPSPPPMPTPRYPQATSISAATSIVRQGNPFASFDQAMKNVIFFMRGDLSSMQPFWQDDEINPDPTEEASSSSTPISSQSAPLAVTPAGTTAGEALEAAAEPTAKPVVSETRIPHSTLQLANFLLILFGMLFVLLIINFIITLLNDFLALRYDHAEAAWLVWMVRSIAEIEALWLFGARQYRRRDWFPSVIYFEDEPAHGRQRERLEEDERREDEVRRENDRLLLERMEVLLGIGKLEMAVNNISRGDVTDRKRSMPGAGAATRDEAVDKRRSMISPDA